jgi:Flp pilus assembly secretin CpaC
MNSGSMGSTSEVKVLSAPTIVTAHNKEAQIIVGESRPIITGSTSTPNTGGSGGPTTSSTVTYKDIAIDLKVTPLIGDDGTIQLTIDQQVNDILGTVPVDGNDQPIIGRRQAKSTINVNDGEMIVLGELQRNKKEKSRGKLGFIFEIPIISKLLGARSKTDSRTELLLFIRPNVLAATIGTAPPAISPAKWTHGFAFWEASRRSLSMPSLSSKPKVAPSTAPRPTPSSHSCSAWRPSRARPSWWSRTTPGWQRAARPR